MYAGMQEIVWLRGELAELDLRLSKPTPFFPDSLSAEDLALNPVYHKRSKHIEIKYNWELQDCQDGLFGAFADDAAISADPDSCVQAFDVYLQAGQECGLKVNFALNKTEMLLGKYADQAEMERRISG